MNAVAALQSPADVAGGTIEEVYMTQELKKRYSDKLKSMRSSSTSITDKFVLLTENELKTLIDVNLALMHEVEDLRQKISEMDTRIDGLDPAPEYKTSDKKHYVSSETTKHFTRA